MAMCVYESVYSISTLHYTILYYVQSLIVFIIYVFVTFETRALT